LRQVPRLANVDGSAQFLARCLMLHSAKRSSELLALHLVNTGVTAWHDINKRLRDFLWIQVIVRGGNENSRIRNLALAGISIRKVDKTI